MPDLYIEPFSGTHLPAPSLTKREGEFSPSLSKRRGQGMSYVIGFEYLYYFSPVIEHRHRLL